MNQGRVDNAFERRWKRLRDECIQMILDAHALAILANVFNHEWEEDSISAHLIHDHLRKLPGKAAWSINLGAKNITPMIASGFLSAKKAKEPDIKFDRQFSLHSESRFEFHIEAKLLSERDWRKPDGKRVHADYYLKRYIGTGIDNILAGNYDDCCLAGYVVNGGISQVAAHLNSKLQNQGRSSEQLLHLKGHGAGQQFRSIHVDPNQNHIHLDHIFLKIP